MRSDVVEYRAVPSRFASLMIIVLVVALFVSFAALGVASLVADFD